MRPEARIELAAASSGESVELARWVCIATRIDPALIRRARLTLARGVDAGVESDLWFGPLVQTAGARYILFHPEVADLLRRQLAQNRQDLARAWRVTRRTHRGLPELVRLEEKLTWLALKGGPRLDRMLDALLRPLIKAMLTGQREGLGRWALNVLPHMPEAVRGSKSARLLRVVAESQLYGGWANLLTTAGEGPTDEEAALLLHGLERTTAGLRLAGDRLEVSEPPEDYSHIIKVPATNPRVLEVTWPGGDDTPEQRRLTWQKGESAYAHHVTLPATVSTLAGDTHRLVHGGEVKRELSSLVFVVNTERRPMGMGVRVENNFVMTTFRSIRDVANPEDFYSGPVTLRFQDSVHDDYASAEIVKAGSTLDAPTPSADRLFLLKLPDDEIRSSFIDSIRPAKLKSAFDFVGKVLAAPGLPLRYAAQKWATFEVGEMTEAGEFTLTPATQIRPEELARWSGSPLIDVNTGDVAGVVLARGDEGGPRLSLYSLNLITREFPEIFKGGSSVVVAFNDTDWERVQKLKHPMKAADHAPHSFARHPVNVQEFDSLMKAAGLADRIFYYSASRGRPDGETYARVLEGAATVLMFITPDFLASNFMASDELPSLLARAEEKGTLVLPVILAESEFPGKHLARFRAFNDPRRPLDELTSDERGRVYGQLTELLSRRLGLQAGAREESRTEVRHDFFIGYVEQDASWAQWVAWQLEEAGYTTFIRERDLAPNDSIVSQMQEAVREAGHTIIILSPDYLGMEHEWRAAFGKDPTGEKGLLLPVRVREVTPTGVLSTLAYIDLVGLDEGKARSALLGGVSRVQPRPVGQSKTGVVAQATFPGVSPTAPHVVTPDTDAPRRFKSDIFVSYSHSDNPPSEGQKGWIDAFAEGLEVRLAQLLGERPVIWRDKNRPDAAYFPDAVDINISESFLFVAIVTTDYITSEWCRKELDDFVRYARQTGGISFGDRSRIFSVIRSEVPRDMMPDELRNVLGYEFFELDQQTGRSVEYSQTPGRDRDQRYWDKLDDLAWDIKETLSAFKAATETVPAEGREVVYLAETTRDVRQERDQIRRELGHRGYTVLPDRELPTYAPDFDAQVRESLARCRMSVHLFGSRYGVIPEGEGGRSVAHRQLELAYERAAFDTNFVTLVWMPPGLEPADERQGALVRELQAGVGASAGTELIQAGLETFKTLILERLSPKPEAPPAADGRRKRIYLICDMVDRPALMPFREVFMEVGFEYFMPPAEDTATQLIGFNRSALKHGDAALLYFGNISANWAMQRLNLLMKMAVAEREKPLAALIYLGPPAMPWKDEFNVPLTQPGFTLTVVKNFEAFSPNTLRPFLKLLGSQEAE